MPDGRRAPRLPQLSAAVVVAVALWLVSRGREPVRATMPVRDTGPAFPPGTVDAVVEGPAVSVLTLRLRPPWLRAGAKANTGLPVLEPRDVELPAGLRDVVVREVIVHLPLP